MPPRKRAPRGSRGRQRGGPRGGQCGGPLAQQPSPDPDDTADPEQPLRNSLRLDLPPITNVYQVFKDLLSKRRNEIMAISSNGGFHLRVGTMCSGTEAPIFALRIINEISQSINDGQTFMEFDHLFSVENEPFKQAYISRNAPGSIVFRDVVDFTDPEATTAPTILGDHCEIPRNIDLLVAGTSCVDFSNLNYNKRNSMQLMSSGSKLVAEWKKSDQCNAKSNIPLRENFFDDFRSWLKDITPAEIQTTEKSIGESSFTFLSTLCYINRHRPKMVIMENVTNAPWDSMCNLFLHAADYAAKHIFLDTKDYYLPQTRKRGYVVALDRHVFGSSADQVIAEWETQLASLKRGASTPIQDWLLSSHDPLTIRARQDESEKTVASGLGPGRDVPSWERSKLRHFRVRRQFQLGNDRPLTAWGLGGIEQPYDRIDKLVLKRQNDRALDCVDIYYLRCLRAGVEIEADPAKAAHAPKGPMQYDIRFKSQIFDLSQNIDRGNINHNFGIAGCLTPRGLNLITDQGRLVSGFEALNLQGLPLRDLDLTRESQDELRDLAGNAMTTTVVGTAMLSLFIAVNMHSIAVNMRDKKEKSRPLNPIVTRIQTVMPYQPLCRPSSMEHTPMETWSTAPEPLSNVQQIIDVSKRCRRYCYCNGSAKYSAEELVCCQVCGIIRCKSCAGNPKHQFGPLQSIENPVMVDTTPQEMMKYFPTALTHIIDKAIDCIPFRPDFQAPEMQSLLLGSLRWVTFYYTKVHVSETVTICYSAKDYNCSFHLQAVISDACVTWYLFLDPWSRGGQLLSKNLGIPPAHMLRPFGRARIYPRLQGPGFVPNKDAWEFWVFTEIAFDIDIAKLYPNSIEIKHIPLENLPSATHGDLLSILGTYDHHPECDVAEDSLHVCTQGPKRYLFKDPTKIGLAQEDCYIISDGCRYLENHEFRDFCVKFLPEWTPQAAGARATASIKGYWERPLADTTRVQVNPPSNLVSYTRQAGSQAVPRDIELQLNEKGHRIWTLASVQIDSNMIADTYMTLLKYERVGPEQWAVVSRSDYSALFEVLAPVNVNLDGIESNVPSTDIKGCNLCCPKLPDVHWMEKITDVAKTSVREPYRLSTEMRSYEEEARGCGEPLQVAVNIKDSKNGKEWKQVTANYEFNVDLLLHRAAGRLSMMKTDLGVLPQIRAFLYTKRGSLSIPNLKFEPFRNSLHRLSGSSSQNGIGRQDIFVNGYALTKQQEISLNWMLERELRPPLFTEREIEECWADHLNLRVLAVAERDISRPGGILADDVGYGKTVVTLALIAAQQNFDQSESLQQRNDTGGNTLALAASLVFVPKHLVNQWRDEAAKFLGWKDTDVLVIKSCNDLQGMVNVTEPDGGTSQPRSKRQKTAKKRMLEKLQAAKLIIVSTTIFDDNYYTWLGKYAGSLAPPRTIPRTNSRKDTTNPNVLGAFQDWYEDATIHARKNLSGFNPTVFNSGQLEVFNLRQQSLQDSWRGVVADHYDLTTRLGLQTARRDRTGKSVRGKKEVATACKEYGNEARATSLTKNDFEANKFVHVLEAFSFARVVYDEFSYENFCVAQFVKNAKAHAKWVLSATPPTGNVKAVCGTGEMLKVHVVRPVKLRPGLPLITEGPIVLRSNSTEKYLSYGNLFTDNSVYERVEQAHKFLLHFASANPFDEEGLGQITVLENAYCSSMSRCELVRYLDIQRDLRDSNLDIPSILRRHKLDEDIVVGFSSERRLRAGLALAYVASVAATDEGDGDQIVASRLADLEKAQKNLKYISDVAIWLILRRSEEVVQKKNDSATSIVEDLAWHFESILEGNAEAFGGVEALQAVTNAIFDKHQFAECSRWIEKFARNERSSEDYFTGLFTLLNKKIGTTAWTKYFDLLPTYVNGLTESEVLAFLQQFGSLDPDSPSITERRKRLRNLIQKTQNSRKKASKGKARMQLEDETDISDEDEEEGNDNSDGDGDDYEDEDNGGNQRRKRGVPTFPRFSCRRKIRGGSYTETESELTDIILKLVNAKDEVIARTKQHTTALNIFKPKGNIRQCSACEQHCNNMRFLPECGHFICSSHLKVRFCGQIKSHKYPNGTGCSSLIHKRSIPVNQIDRLTMDVVVDPMFIIQGKPVPEVSYKSWNVYKTINGILQSDDEKVLVFYQFDKQKKEICQLLDYYSTPYETHPATRATNSAASRNPDKDRVRILKINSEEAAGSNYQDASHVIFINTPVFAKQEDFEKYVKQAKGRAVRHGQLRDVNVYYFVTVNTFEVDLLQLRKKSYIRIQTEEVADFVPMDLNNRTDSNGDTEMMDAPGTSS
ncbi:hypothetical protein F4825DRAFT_163570 [Nemania diffusa]|nr:hypothetical protein F4825DRAFT_163570 [Nemania diffusa]